MIICEANVGSFFKGKCLKCKKAAVFLDTDGEGKFWAQCDDHEHCGHSVVLEEPEEADV